MPETSESILTFKGSLKMHQTLNDKYALKYTNFQEISARLVLNSDVDTAMANVQRD